MKFKFSFFVLIMLLLVACSDDGNNFPKVIPYPEVDEPVPPVQPTGIEQYTVFQSGADGINSYRIPSICTTKKGTLLAFGEARRDSYKDRSFTNIVLKRSTNNGKTWSRIQYLTSVPSDGNPGAYINPCPVVDMETGKIFLFMIYWKNGNTDKEGHGTRALLTTSTDDGENWSNLLDVTDNILPEGQRDLPKWPDNEYEQFYSFGPGSGFQMKGGQNAGRLIIPSLPTFIVGTAINKRILTVYSDDHGNTWKIGNIAANGGEFQIAESPLGTLVYNIRGSKGRGYAKSMDGGINWSDRMGGSIEYYPTLPTLSCQGSVLGDGNTLYYSGPLGGIANTDHDDRCKLMLYKSLNSGTTWDSGQLLYDKAAGYSCLTTLSDGRIAILFEAGPDADGFSKKFPVDWMRLDLIILPKE